MSQPLSSVKGSGHSRRRGVGGHRSALWLCCCSEGDARLSRHCFLSCLWSIYHVQTTVDAASPAGEGPRLWGAAFNGARTSEGQGSSLPSLCGLRAGGSQFSRSCPKTPNTGLAVLLESGACACWAPQSCGQAQRPARAAGRFELVLPPVVTEPEWPAA